MKCTVVVVLCAGLAAASKHRINRQYDTSNAEYYSEEQLPYSGSVEGNSLHEHQYQHGNDYAAYGQQYVDQYPVQIGPTQATTHYGGAPLAPYPPQYNHHQIAPQYGHYGAQLPQQNYGFSGLQQNYGYPSPQQNYEYSSLALFAPPAPKTTLVTPTPTRPPKTTTSAPNNIFSLLFSVSQLSSSLSQPTTTKRPAAIIVPVTTGQPAPKAQIFSFNPQAQYPQYPPYPPQRAVLTPFLQ